MSRKQYNRDPAKRAEKRQRQREAAARGSVSTPRQSLSMSRSQMGHASSNKAKRKAREGERRMGDRPINGEPRPNVPSKPIIQPPSKDDDEGDT